jgi:hypothetical protein
MLRRIVPFLLGLAVSFVVLAAPAMAEFGIASFSGSITNQDGSPDTQAGSHPFALTASFSLNSHSTHRYYPGEASDGEVKDIEVNLPPGIVGDTVGVTQCPQQDIMDHNEPLLSDCPVGSQVGQLTIHLESGLGYDTFPVYNMVPGLGEPVQFAADVSGIAPVYIDTHVRTGGDYGVTATLRNVTSAIGFVSNSLTIWGVPGDPVHDAMRGAICINAGPGETPECFFGGNSAGGSPKPYITLGSSCVGPQATTLSMDSWQNPGSFLTASAFMLESTGTPLGNEGCDRLDFTPTLSVTPESSAVDTPTGVHVDLHLPPAGLEEPEGLAEADLKNAVVTLPAGMVVNPSAAGGLAACSPAQIALSSPEPAACPDASKVGTVEIDTPILGHQLGGSVYVAEQGNNPFNSLLALYITINDPETGIVVKVAGNVVLDPVTGQLTATFDNNPQLPFSDLKLDFFGGPRAALVNPDVCGAYTAYSQLTPWSSETPVEPSSVFTVSQGCHGALFNPGFSAGTTNNQAGAFSPVVLSLSRQDGEEGLAGLQATLAPGLLAKLAGVPLCSSSDAAAGTCSAASQIGTVTASAGAGSDPVSVSGGRIYLTGPYNGGPFGEVVVIPAAVGPYNLGNVVVRGSIKVDPHTTQATVVSDPLPQILQGIPVDLRQVYVSLNRPEFTFNPTNCEALSIPATLTSAQGASASVSSRFQAANCAALAFKPSFTVSTQASTSKQNGASLDVKVGYPQGSEANIHSVAVALPKQLPSRLTTIQQACPEATFNANPASCPAGSNIGTATAGTPVLANPVTGPAYLVSHGGAAFPNLVLILQGEGVTLDLVGSIDIKKGITSSAFDAIPDAPISAFDLTLPEGPHSALATDLPAKVKGDLCGTSMVMPTTITGQNGAVIQQQTKIAVSGCPKVKAKVKKKPKPKHPKKGKKKRK